MIALLLATDAPMSVGEKQFLALVVPFVVGLLLAVALRSIITDAIKRSRKEGP